MPSPQTTERIITIFLENSPNIGITPVNDGDKILQSAEGVVFRRVIEVAEFTQAITTADLNFGIKIFDFLKAGRLKIHGSRVDVSIVTDATGTAVNGEIGLGTALASGAADTLATTEEDLFAGANAPFTAIAADSTERVTGTDIDKTAIDATAGAPDVHLNVALDGGVAGTLTLSGTVEIWGVFVPVHV